MTGTHLDKKHSHDISSHSSYLFLSLLLLACDLIISLVSVFQNKGMNEPSQYENGEVVWAYSASLGIFAVLEVRISSLKLVSSLCCHKCKHQWRSELESVVFNVLFVAMGILYLAGDNLPTFVCSAKVDTRMKAIKWRVTSLKEFHYFCMQY